MKALLDHCLPAELRDALLSFVPFPLEISLAKELGWQEMKNGALLEAASKQFDFLITLDRGISFQQHLPSYDIRLLSLQVPNSRPDTVVLLTDSIIHAMQTQDPQHILIPFRKFLGPNA